MSINKGSGDYNLLLNNLNVDWAHMKANKKDTKLSIKFEVIF